MKFIPYGHQSIDKSDIRAVVKVLHSDWLTQGPAVKRFEEALRRSTGAKYAVVVSSGTAALHIAALTAGIKEGSEVITSPITFLASANSAVYCKAKPVFADVLPDTVTIDPDQIKKKITRRTKAIIPVHFAGHPADLAAINKIAKKYKLIVIEDAAHAIGAKYKGSKIGSCKYSDMTIFSFHPVKTITTAEGGAILTNSKDFYQKLLMYREHGITKNKDSFVGRAERGSWYYQMQLLGFNYRMSDIQAALGFSQLRKLNRFLKRRRSIVSQYNRAFSRTKGLSLPAEKSIVKSAWHLYVVRVRKRAKVFEALRRKGVGVQVHYIPVHLQPFYKNNFGYRKGMFPVAERYYKEAISLPLYPDLTTTDIKRVTRTVKGFLNV